MMETSPLVYDLTIHLAEIVQASSAAITSVTMERRIQSWNPGAEALFGFSAEEALGADLMMIVPPHRMEEALGFYTRVRGGEVFSSAPLQPKRRRVSNPSKWAHQRGGLHALVPRLPLPSIHRSASRSLFLPG